MWLYDNKRNMGTHAVWKGVSLYKNVKICYKYTVNKKKIRTFV